MGASVANKDFLQTIFDMMNRRMDDLDTAIKANTAISQKALDEVRTVAPIVQQHEKALKALERKHGKKLDLPPNVIYLIALGAVILLVIVATLLRIDLGNLL